MGLVVFASFPLRPFLLAIFLFRDYSRRREHAPSAFPVRFKQSRSDHTACRRASRVASPLDCVEATIFASLKYPTTFNRSETTTIDLETRQSKRNFDASVIQA
ncbi:hypothetical protein E4U28_001227, partial [Claviceps purpurea]